MKDAWFLATSRADLSGDEIIDLYSRRFTIEESFRDDKDDLAAVVFTQVAHQLVQVHGELP